MRSFQIVQLICAISVYSILAACSKGDSDSESVADSSTNIYETVVSEASSNAGTSEGAGSISVLAEDIAEGLVELTRGGKNRDSLVKYATCSYAPGGGNKTCSGATATIDWDSCTIGTATLTGGWTEVYSTANCCSGTTNFITGSCSVTRTSPSGSVITLSSGATITTDTVAHTAYDGTSIPATGTVIASSGTSRSITINGLHRVMRGPRGTKWFDHSIRTTSPITVTGTRALGTRTITGGTIVVHHNIAEYKATTFFSNTTPVRWTSGCCYPTSGIIDIGMQGSIAGTASIQFTSTCGFATFTNIDGATSTLQLRQCN